MTIRLSSPPSVRTSFRAVVLLLAAFLVTTSLVTTGGWGGRLGGDGLVGRLHAQQSAAERPVTDEQRAPSREAADTDEGTDEESPATEPQPRATEAPADESKPAAATAKDPPGLVRIAKDDQVWIDPKRKMVVVNGYVALRRGQLEMFACPKGTKEHESVVAVYAKPSFVHAGLLAIGAEVGQPVQFTPEYSPATGTRIEVLVLWKDEQGKKHQVRAQEWLREVKTGQEMNQHWVFAGSGFWVEEGTGKQYYHADGGDFICVSNFPTATLDLPVASSQENANLMFEAFTERIPPLKTEVRLILYPLNKPQPEAADGQAAPDGQPARDVPNLDVPAAAPKAE